MRGLLGPTISHIPAGAGTNVSRERVGSFEVDETIIDKYGPNCRLDMEREHRHEKSTNLGTQNKRENRGEGRRERNSFYGPGRGSKQAWNDTYVKAYIGEFNMEQNIQRTNN